MLVAPRGSHFLLRKSPVEVTQWMRDIPDSPSTSEMMKNLWRKAEANEEWDQRDEEWWFKMS